MPQDSLKDLDSPDPARREAAASHFGDLFTSYKQPSDAEAKTVIAALVSAAVREHVPAIRDEILNSLVLSGRSPAIAEVSLDPLLTLLGDANDNETGAILTTLGYSRRSEHRPVLLRYLNHPNEEIRKTASAALTELGS